MKKAIIILLVLISSSPWGRLGGVALAQTNQIFSPNIASLTVMADDDWQGMPVADLNGGVININFDELSHNYHRYIYKVEHCESDWTKSEDLFTSDYIRGFYDDNTIEDNEESNGTYQLYTHYKLSIPNEKMSLTMSGNYKLTVYDNDNDDEPMFTCCFMLCDNTAGISFEVLTNTDADINGRHQQLNMEVSYGNVNVTDPQNQLHTVILQDQRWDYAVWNPKAQFVMRDGLRWEHCRDLIFMAGDEYHKFEMLDPTHTTMGLAHVGWDAENSQWHAYVEPDYPRPHYSYDVDADGAFLIRNSENDDCDVTCDYILTHFELHSPKQNGAVYLNGVWTNDSFEPKFEMIWNDETQVYESTQYLKQGYYSYRYLLKNDDGTLKNISSEGNFYETENRYDALLYFKAPGDRAERLVAHGHN